MHDGASDNAVLRIATPPVAPPKLDPLGDEEGLLVLRCPGMSAEDKLAWGFLRDRSGWPYEPGWDWGASKFKVSAQDLAEHQRVDSASGRRRRGNLADRWKLIEVHHRCAVSGNWTISLVRPSLALAEHLGLVPAEPQSSLFNEPADEATSESLRLISAGDALLRGQSASSAELREGSAEPLTEPPTPSLSRPAVPPLARAPSGHQNTSVDQSVSTDIDIGNTSDHPRELSTAKDQGRQNRRGGTVSATADREAEEISEEELHRQFAAKRASVQRELGIAEPEAFDVNRVAAVAATLVRRLPDERSQSMARERWIYRIRREVDDPLLKLSPCVKVACAIADGRLKVESIEEIFAELNKHRRAGTLRKSPGAYFVGSAMQAFRRLGLAWEKPPQRPR
jgi:hypothetical protein